MMNPCEPTALAAGPNTLCGQTAISPRLAPNATRVHPPCSGSRQRFVDLIENTPNFDQPQSASPGFWGVSAPRTGASALRLIKSTGRQDFRYKSGAIGLAHSAHDAEAG